jgi:hypothetical protein
MYAGEVIGVWHAMPRECGRRYLLSFLYVMNLVSSMIFIAMRGLNWCVHVRSDRIRHLLLLLLFVWCSSKVCWSSSLWKLQQISQTINIWDMVLHNHKPKGKKSEGHHYWGIFFHGTQISCFTPLDDGILDTRPTCNTPPSKGASFIRSIPMNQTWPNLARGIS